MCIWERSAHEEVLARVNSSDSLIEVLEWGGRENSLAEGQVWPP